MITLDCETKSYADLKKIGAWNYSLDPTTDVICLCYILPTEPNIVYGWVPSSFHIPMEGVEDWRRRLTCSNDMPKNLRQSVEDGTPIEAHNVSFEEALWENVLVPKYGWAPVPPDNWRDIMATACYLSLPAALDKLSLALGGEGKDPEGSRLIAKYSKLHLKTASPIIPPEDGLKFLRYCEDDVKQSAGIGDFLGDLPPRELEIFQIDRAVNRRGIYLDLEGIANASVIVDQCSKELTDKFRGIVELNPTQRDKVKQWFSDHGLDLPDMTAGTIDKALGNEETVDAVEVSPGIYDCPVTAMTPEVREALEIKREVSRVSTKKLDAMARNADSTGRARNQTRYHGATTGRSTGSGFQPLNLARPFEFEGMDAREIAEIIPSLIAHRDPELLDLIFGNAMETISKASRHWIKAEPGYKLLAADFTSIEAIILACLADETWKIDSFRNREPIYERMADKIYGLPPGTVTKKTHPYERQDGKIGELAFGYQGALNAWRSFDKTDRHTDERIIEICRAWRREHPNIVNMWYGYERAMKQALLTPTEEFEYGGIIFKKVEHFLTIELLNGKKLWYFQPEFRSQMPHYHQPDKKLECKGNVCDCQPRNVVTYMSRKGGKWMRVATYGGKLVENVVQAHSREILEDKKIELSRRGYSIILSIYDEIICEESGLFGSLKKFKEIMLRREGFYVNWPINIDAWKGSRYGK